MNDQQRKIDETPEQRIKRIEREVAERARQSECEGRDRLLEAMKRRLLADRKRAMEQQQEGGA